MLLNEILRGLLERYIDEIITGIPTLVSIYRQGNPAQLGVKTMEDYIFGLAQGMIFGEFVITYKTMYFQYPPNDIIQEVGNIIFRRSREIRDAIFSQG